MQDKKRPKAGEDFGAVGRARRFACALETGSPVELWCFAPTDIALVRRLASFGDAGVGGFSGGWGEDEEGVFALRRLPSKTVDGLHKGEKLDGLTALAKLRDLARALAVCEKKAVFPGPLRPAEIALGSPGRADAFVLAEGWVRALVGGGHGHGSAGSGGGASGSVPSAPSPRWTPPEQAGGAPWDNAANRYVLGLVLYRLLAGAHPFSGIGLRDAMVAQQSKPPPFGDEIARTLKPGIQSFVLAMLDPDPSQRPHSAEVIAHRCEELMRDAPAPIMHGAHARSGSRGHRPSPEAADVGARQTPVAAEARRESLVRAAGGDVAATPVDPPPQPPQKPWKRYAFAAGPIALGLAIAGAGLAASRAPDPPPPVEKRTLSSASPMQKTTSEACAGCHARQVAEWQRSVMAHAVKSPLFGALESVVEEQVGRDDRCPNGAGVLRKVGGDVCRDEKTGLTLTGTGGEHWCVNCHSAADNLKSTVPSWSSSFSPSQKPLRDVLSQQAMEGISCAVCHQTIGPVHGTTAYDGNPTWTSPVTGAVFRMRPEDGTGVRGIANSGYLLDPTVLVSSSLGKGGSGDPIVHRRVPEDTGRYLRSSEFCGACHDVRLFGTDSIGVRDRGEHFKRLRNAYSEWKTWADAEKSAGRTAATCQDCHMSLYPWRLRARCEERR